MSLILTALVPEFVVQVSETRVSFKNGRPPRDDQRKTLVFFGDRFRGLVGWVGLAEAGPKHNTGDWLVDEFHVLTRKPVGDIATALATRATKHFERFRDDKGAVMPCEFVLAGWYNARTGPEPVVVTISNFTMEPGHLPLTRREFSARPCAVSKRRPVKRPVVIAVSGWEDAADDFRARFVGLGRVLRRRGTNAAVVQNVLIDVMRRAARKYGEDVGPVGSSIITVVLPRDAEAIAAFYPWRGAKTPAEYHPDLVTPDMVMKRVELWYSDTPPPWWKP